MCAPARRATTTNDAVNRQEDAPYAADLAAAATLPAFTGTAAKAADAYLLTGATGHLGAWLLRMLLEETHADVMLVRGNDDADARARLDARYRAMFGGALPSRVSGSAAATQPAAVRHGRRQPCAVADPCHAGRALRGARQSRGRLRVHARGQRRREPARPAFASAAKVAHVHYISTQYTGSDRCRNNGSTTRRSARCRRVTNARSSWRKPASRNRYCTAIPRRSIGCRC